jgi:hypothetical protein
MKHLTGSNLDQKVIRNNVPEKVRTIASACSRVIPANNAVVQANNTEIEKSIVFIVIIFAAKIQ